MCADNSRVPSQTGPVRESLVGVAKLQAVPLLAWWAGSQSFNTVKRRVI